VGGRRVRLRGRKERRTPRRTRGGSGRVGAEGRRNEAEWRWAGKKRDAHKEKRRDARSLARSLAIILITFSNAPTRDALRFPPSYPLPPLLGPLPGHLVVLFQRSAVISTARRVPSIFSRLRGFCDEFPRSLVRPICHGSLWSLCQMTSSLWTRTEERTFRGSKPKVKAAAEDSRCAAK